VIGLRVSVVEHEVIPARPNTPPIDRRAAYLHFSDKPEDGLVILDEWPEPAGSPAEMFQLGIHHFALWVDDVEAVIARAAAAGTAPFLGPVDIDSDRYGEPGGTPMRTVLLRDPDGTIVQCDQRDV